MVNTRRHQYENIEGTRPSRPSSRKKVDGAEVKSVHEVVDIDSNTTHGPDKEQESADVELECSSAENPGLERLDVPDAERTQVQDSSDAVLPAIVGECANGGDLSPSAEPGIQSVETEARAEGAHSFDKPPHALPTCSPLRLPAVGPVPPAECAKPVSKPGVVAVEKADKENVVQAKATAKPVVRGKNKSNRFWKEPRGRSSSIIHGKHVHRGWEKRKELREKLSQVQEFSRALLQERKEAKAAARMRAEENRRRREENARKAEIVQVITNTAKIKKMKKKQLRMIQKRDTTDMVRK